MNNRFNQIFKVQKPIIGMVHLPASPGQPLASSNLDFKRSLELVRTDTMALIEGGIDGLLFCNERDLPYTAKLKSEVSAWTGFMIGSLYSELDIPFGVNLLWDPIASIETAAATGASFVREVMCGSFASDMGILTPDPALIAETRTRLKAEDLALLTNIVPEFANSLGGRSVAELAKSAEYFGFDGILISGPVAGITFDMQHIVDAKKVVSSIPVIANTGVKLENLSETLKIADAVIVGSSLKIDGSTFNAIDAKRVKKFMSMAVDIRKSI